ncbi:TMV resistance protein N-like [Quercus lobata]|uniref:TIR domain-containing protein n=1 Tax=Quercus lobata TaxID=97700 RepID=A0A7N2R5X2_QUELO|nr:TMV resistance protein N-like [Quercus lobata]XP_030974178.1 TMV resistance protein N-like [Quercus lobata]XP_030974179.1 TMV resistance protein N-like [Quercus lobata]XP_030974180.1 TMV resistance protein N-like [Quercus lobata]XP_030974181.1 TMV resistance protein N-like [Quercus lobata]XP_030974182.1 TMV resistance protein N-like [Quercus lobata]XP_030974183.1 TMV resistance protein N-like [Quercus lobata]XP_030974184.1 TMV resistance protein N-like [Quercus lobata]
MVVLTNEGASSSSSTCRWKYDVFLSFRGEDTRTGFTTYLYKALEQKGINTFMDDKLPRGEEISAELLKTIEESMILVIVFSKNYAESKWCLNELVKIVECSENKQMVLLLPIFYNVEPREVRNQLGNFGIALANHEKEFKDNMGKMPRWREALSKAASVSGWHYEEGRTTYKSECDFIQGIVKEISSATFNRRPLYDAEYLVGIDSRVAYIKSLLNIKSNEVPILGIHGLPGVGKTTIANAVYCKIAYQFEGSCFLEKVREKSINCGMIQLQEKLLSKILQDNYLKVDSEFEGTNLIKKRICCKKVLLVLDDVDNSVQIEKLLGKCDWFASGSIVIITTRDKHVLSTLPKGHLIYKVKELGPCEARDLFNMHAFRTNEPKEDYSKLAKLILSYAKGLPLALKVMGSALCGKSIDEWSNAFEMYKNIQHEKIQEILKISFIGLDKNEKHIFLDIACFFKGFSKDYVVKILDACDLYPKFGIGKLIDKCLIIDEDGTLWMHDLLQQMGREIAQEEFERLENHSRIWCHEDAYKLLTRNKGSDKIRGIMWCEPEPITVSLKASAFEKMENLKFLIVENVQISQELEYLSNELRLFKWSGYNFSLPSKFCPKKLVGLEVSSSCIGLEKLFEQGCNYKYLKSIYLEDCQSITRLPDLCAPNLETLDISYCDNLIEIHDSIGLLDKLECLSLCYCMKLQILPGTLKLNKSFFLDNCPRLEKFPNVHPEMKCLDFCVNESNIREWPLSLRYLTEGIIQLEIQRCENLGKFWDSTNKLQLLEETDTPIHNCFVINPDECGDLTLECYREILIDLDFCMKNDFFPALRYVTIEDSNIVSIPEGISRLSRLEYIHIRNCKELREIQIPRLPQSIRCVRIEKCPSLLPQSSSRLLNQFGKILEILPNRVREGARSDILMDLFDDSESDSDSDSETKKYYIFLPGTEIPKSLKFNHQSFGNSISFKVGCKFPKLAVCVALRSRGDAWVSVFVNGCQQYSCWTSTEGSYGELWLGYVSLGQLNKPNPSEQNRVEVKVEIGFGFVKWLGVNVECICCPQKSDITYLPLPSDRNGCGSSSVLNDTELPPFQPVFPISNGFEPGLKGFLGDLNLSLAAPNNSELLALLPGPNMDHEVSNTVNDLGLLKGIHNDGCDLSLSLNDSNERESEPPVFPDLTNGFDFGFAQPNLELGSGVSSGFHLGSSSMAHASVNDDSDFYMGSSSMAHDCLNDDSDFNMGPPPKKARTS